MSALAPLLLCVPARLPEVLAEGRAVRGPSGAISDMREEIWECTKPAPRSLLELVPMRGLVTRQGTCGQTVASITLPQHCKGEKGSWKMHAASELTAAASCAALCSKCAQCKYFSFSMQESDCSWFASCDLDALRTRINDFDASVFSTASMSDANRYTASVAGGFNAAVAAERDHSWRQVLSNHRKSLRAGTDSAFVQVADSDMKTLHHIVRYVGARISGETGFASGVSALAIVTALADGGAHVAVDPFQGAYRYDGLRAVRSYLASAPERRLRFQHLNETASMAVAYLHTQRVCFDAFFIDDGHKFDDALVELFHAHKMLSVGGALMLHDNWMPSIKKLESFIQSNMPNLHKVPNPLEHHCCISIYTKSDVDRRKWNHFVDFQ